MVDKQRGAGEAVRSVLVQATLARGPAHVFVTGNSHELGRAYAQGAQASSIYVHAALVATLDSGRMVSSERPVMGCSVQRLIGQEPVSVVERLSRGRREIESHIRTMLGLGERRPPHLAWDPLIESLAGSGITLSEDALTTLPITIELSRSLRNELCRADDASQ